MPVEGEIGLRLELWDQAAPLPADSLGISLGPVGESTTPAASGLGVFSESGPSGSGGSPDPGWNLIWGDGALVSPARARMKPLLHELLDFGGFSDLVSN